MHPNRLRSIAFLILLLMACSLTSNPILPFAGGENSANPDENDGRVIIPSASESTPTPFLPLDPTARAMTPTAIPAPSWGRFPGPTIPAGIPIPPPVDMIQQPVGQRNFLLLGSDQRPASGGFRTDTILLVTLSPDLKKVSVTSFPRDLYVYIPGWTMQRINTALPHGGFELMQSTFEYNFGVIPDYYAMINFNSFVHVVDQLGGIYVNVANTLTDHRDGFGDYTVTAGRQLMDGETALWYVRSRYTSSDFERNRRQQEVMLGIFFRMISLNGLQRAPELYNLFKNNISTNAGFSELSPFLGLAADLAADSSILQMYNISRSHATGFTTSTGAAVLLPDYNAISALMKQALNAP